MQYFTLFLLFCSQWSIAQSNISGRMFLGGSPLAGARIVLNPSGQQTTSDGNGAFFFSGLEPGVYMLEVSAVGTQPLAHTVELKSDQTLELQLNAEPMQQALPEVLISEAPDFRGIQRLPENSALQINASKKMEVVDLNTLDANLASNNTRQVFAKVPGVHIWENDGSGIQIGVATRGLSPNRTLEFNVRQNGYDVAADPFGYTEAYYNPPLEAVEKVEVLRGPASLQYGPQFGGLLQYRLKKAPANRKFGLESAQSAGSNGQFNSFLSAGGSSGSLDYFGYFHHRQGKGWRENSGFNVRHGHLRLGYQWNTKWRTELEYTRMDLLQQVAGGLTDAQFAVDPQWSGRSRNWFNAQWNLGAVRVRCDISEHTHFEYLLSGMISERSSIGFTQAIIVPDTILASTREYAVRQIDRDRYENFNSEARFLTNYAMGVHRQTLAVGLRYYQGHTLRRQRGVGDTGTAFNLDLQTGLFPREFNYNGRNIAAFAEHIFRFGRWALVPGIRLEQLNLNSAGRLNLTSSGEAVPAPELRNNRTFLLAGFGAEYHPHPEMELYGNITQAYRPVGFSDLTPSAATDVIDPNLKDAKGWTADLGFRGHWKDVVNFDLSGFYMLYDNKIGSIAQKDSSGAIFLYRTNLGTASHAGLEAYAELNLLRLFRADQRFGQFFIFTSLAWTQARYGDFPVTSVSNGQITETNLEGKHVENAPEYIHRFGASYALRGFSASWGLSAVDGVYTDAANTETPSANAQTGFMPAYQVMDFSFNWKLREKYTLFGSVNNLADVRYATRRAGGSPGPGLVPADGRNWNLGIRLTL